MGMGSIPCRATIITEEFISGLPTAGPALTNLLVFMTDQDIREQCLDVDNGDMWADDIDEDAWKEFTHRVGVVQKCFEADTGLKVYPFYYDEEDGDRYDDLPEGGAYWSVDGVYQLTPAAEKVKDYLRDVQWTVYG